MRLASSSGMINKKMKAFNLSKPFWMAMVRLGKSGAKGILSLE
jgi:hypothetical protein